MDQLLIIQLMLRMSLVITIALLLTRAKPFRRLLYKYGKLQGVSYTHGHFQRHRHFRNLFRR